LLRDLTQNELYHIYTYVEKGRDRERERNICKLATLQLCDFANL
jgi:hypothetical protein